MNILHRLRHETWSGFQRLADEAAAEIERLQKIESAARNLVAQKGRHNTEIAYKKLVEALATIKESEV